MFRCMIPYINVSDGSVFQLMIQKFMAGHVAIEGFAESTAMPKNTWWVTMDALPDTGTTH